MATKLEKYITELSQEIHCSQWDNGIEFRVWDMINDKKIPETITAIRIKQEALANDYWVAWSEEFNGIISMPLALWKKHLKKRLMKSRFGVMGNES
ncbi:MAG: hypothetical protein J7M14_03175 [Planctomycetes bacterium]|nr:hypothetical protein [Planctomycetota bacterium]